MEFGLSEEQVMLQDALPRFLAGTGGLERTRTFAAGKDRRAPDVLQGLAELGVTGLIIPEVHGGVGLSLLDAALAAEQLGRFVAPSPFAATAAEDGEQCLRAQRGGELRVEVAIHQLQLLAIPRIRNARRIALDPRHDVLIFGSHLESHARFDLHLRLARVFFYSTSHTGSSVGRIVAR